jgi:hypothetical protein
LQKCTRAVTNTYCTINGQCKRFSRYILILITIFSAHHNKTKNQYETRIPDHYDIYIRKFQNIIINLSFYHSMESVPVPVRPSLGLMSRASCHVLLSILLSLADHKKLTGTSQPNAWGTLLPPSPPEPQRGHTRTRNRIASQLASTAELPLPKS